MRRTAWIVLALGAAALPVAAQVKLTVTSELFQPTALGVGIWLAVIVGKSLSTPTT